MNKFIKWLGIVLLFGMVVLNGCSTVPKPFEYQPDNELKKGPGLFSGEEGKFTIYRRPALLEIPANKQKK